MSVAETSADPAVAEIVARVLGARPRLGPVRLVAVDGPAVPGLVFGYGAVTLPEIGEGLRRLRRVVGRGA